MDHKITTIFSIAVLLGTLCTGILPGKSQLGIRGMNEGSTVKEMNEDIRPTSFGILPNNQSLNIPKKLNFNFIGPSYVNSSGKGHHYGRLFKIVRIDAPIPIIAPGRALSYWAILCIYTDENAKSEIIPLRSENTSFINGRARNDNETITIKGKHWILTGIVKLGIDFKLRFFRKLPLINIIEKFPCISKIFKIINNVDGEFFWYWNTSTPENLPEIFRIPLYAIKTFISWSMLMFWFIVSPFQIKTQIIGHFEPLSFRGYSPFFTLWNEIP